MSSYNPRLTAPALNDPNYINYTYGGYNYCIVIDNNTIIAYEARATLDRGINEPSSEPSIRGSNDALTENYQKNIVAGAYIPTKHSYIDNDDVFCAFDKLKPIVEKVKEPSYIKIPKLYKNPLADVFPKLRSRLGLTIQRSADCGGCNLCAERCSFGAIQSGITNRKCIRCLKCVEACPRQALKIKLGLPLKLYLRKKKANELIIYI